VGHLHYALIHAQAVLLPRLFSFEHLNVRMNTPDDRHRRPLVARPPNQSLAIARIGLEFALENDMETLAIPNEEEMVQAASARVLVADDDPHVVAALEILLNGHGYLTHSVRDPMTLLEALRHEKFDVILMDLNYTRDTTGGAEGLELVKSIRSMDETLPLVVMTAWSTVELAVEALRRGASDFINKPWSNLKLVEKVQEQVERCHAMRHARRQRQEEEQEAREIHKGLLPSVIPNIRGYAVSASTQSVGFVGGDFYDVARISDTKIAFCIADAAGKGLPAALLMSNLQATLKSLIGECTQPREVCTRANRILFDIMPANKFISFFYGVLDSKTNRFTYCNAGHCPPVLVREDGRSCTLNNSGAVFGHFSTWPYEQADVEFQRGDSLLMFSDGVVEASDPEGNQFGEEQLVQVTREFSSPNAHSLRNALMQAVSAHCHGQFLDDATLIVLHRG
jgi:sigma-B regulation protein RsbU (phosphoserine phosphatase)